MYSYSIYSFILCPNLTWSPLLSRCFGGIFQVPSPVRLLDSGDPGPVLGFWGFGGSSSDTSAAGFLEMVRSTISIHPWPWFFQPIQPLFATTLFCASSGALGSIGTWVSKISIDSKRLKTYWPTAHIPSHPWTRLLMYSWLTSNFHIPCIYIYCISHAGVPVPHWQKWRLTRNPYYLTACGTETHPAHIVHNTLHSIWRPLRTWP